MILMKRLRLLPIMLLSVLAFISCDEDYNTIGGDLIGGQFDSLPKYQPGVKAYSEKLGPVQTNNLPVNLFGVYKDPVYGLQKANILTQLSLSTSNPDFGTEPVLDSVVLTLPYFSKQVDVSEEGTPIYKLDSVYGNSPFKINISRSTYFLNDFDPTENFESRQKYYSNQGDAFAASVFGDPIYTNESFKPSARQVKYKEYNSNTGETDTLVKTPRLRVALDKEFFQQNIIEQQGSSELANDNNFRNYIRGLYFSAEAINDNGSLIYFNLSHKDSNITLYYSSKVKDVSDVDEDGDTSELIYKPATYNLTFGSNKVNTYTQNFPAEFLQQIESSSEETGSKNLFLKGGEGSIAVVKLFENEQEIEDIKANNWLINEASLEFYVDNSKVVGGAAEPERIYIYDLENNLPLIDYKLGQRNETTPVNSLVEHSSRLVRDEDGNGVRYKIRITEFVKAIIRGEVESRKLGVVVTQNINLTSNVALKNSNDNIDRVPTGSVISPEGTVLYGNLADDVAKRLKFNIYYTETNN